MSQDLVTNYTLIDYDFAPEENIFYEKSNPLKTAISLVLAITLLTASCLIVWKNCDMMMAQQGPPLKWALMALALGMFAAFIFLLVDLALVFLWKRRESAVDYKSDFQTAFVRKNVTYINILVTSTLLCILVNGLSVINGIAELNSAEKMVRAGTKNGESVKLMPVAIPWNTICLTYVKNVVQTVAAMFLFMLVVKCITQFIAYRMHFVNFKTRIVKNNNKIKTLRMLNTISKERVDANVNKWAASLFRIISGNQNVVGIDNFHVLFERDAVEIFSVFDVDHDERITEDEFIQTYAGIVAEKKKIARAIKARDEGLSRIKVVLYPLFTSLFVFFASWIWGYYMDMRTGIAGLMMVILPLNFVFGSVLSETFESIVFALFIRPFDAGDVVVIDKKTYTVLNFGLIYSTFDLDGKCVNVPNASIRKNFVTNLMFSKYKLQTYKLKLEYASCRDKIDDLKIRILRFLVDNKKLFSQEFEVFDIRFEGEEILQMKIAIKIEVFFASKKITNIRKDMFSLFLRDTTKELGFVYK